MLRREFPLVIGLATAVCGLVLLAGCGKKETAAPASTNAAVEIPPAPAAQPAAPQAPAPVAVAPADSQGALNQAQAAMNAKNYDKAAELMINLQLTSKQPLTAEQATAVANKMRELQQYVMGGVASGDPNAIAAAKRIRAASTPR